MKISVTGQKIKMDEEEVLVQNSENIYFVDFTFDESWDGFAKTAVFEQGYSRVSVPLEHDRCAIPAKCLKRAGAYVKIGVFGLKDGQQMPTVWCKTAAVQPGSGVSSGSSSDPGYSYIVGALGDPSGLETESKSIVGALNELKKAIDSGETGETASNEEVENTLDDIFGQEGEKPGDPGTPPGNTATNGEVGDILDDIFAPGGDRPEESAPGDDLDEDDPGSTATNEEVGDLLDDVFG